MNSDIKKIAVETIRSEAESILQLENYIDDSFEEAVKLLHRAKGRVVVTGIGKSAIVGEKIVATLNSTGTPALFMHAADAIHGDLGMIQEEDVVVAISKSGDSPEIKVLTPLIKSFGNKIIAVVGNTSSYLAQHASIIINATVNKEACTNNLAPTNSTTAQMVIGDALAVCLMQLNGFTGRDFARYHPGGNLGKRLYLKVDDLYKQNSKPKVLPSSPMKKVIIEISESRLGVTAVLDDQNKLMGIITDGDVRRMLEKTDNISNLRAEDILSLHPKTIQPEVLAVEALEALKQNDINQLIVVDELQNYLGVLHLHDLIKEGII